MTRVVVAGSENDFRFGVIDFTTAGSPAVQLPNPGFGGGCRVAIDGTIAVVGNVLGGQVRVVDVSNPATPVLQGTVSTVLGGIGAIAISGNRVAVGEANGNRVAFLDISNPAAPTQLAIKATSVNGYGSLAFSADSNVLVGAGSNNFSFAQIDFTNPASPSTSSHTVPFGGSLTVDADAGANRMAVGDQNGNTVALLNATTFAVLATANSGLNGVMSVAVSGSVVLASSANSFPVAKINFGVSPPAVNSFNPTPSGGWTTALSGTAGVCGLITGTTVVLVNAGASPPSVLGSVNAVIASISTLGISDFTAPPPPTPAISLSVASLAFGPTRVGSTKTLALTVTNSGTAQLNVNAPAISGSGFSVSPGGAFNLAPGASRTLNVAFGPGSVGSFSGTLTLTSNDPARPSVAVAMSGSGAVPRIAVSPASLSFGTVAVCQSQQLPQVIQNQGGVDLTVSSVTTGAPFSVPATSAVIAPGASRTVSVSFAPSAQGAASGALTIASDDPASPSKTVALSGTGGPIVPPAISVTPANALNLGAVPLQFFVGMRVTIANTGPCQPLAVTLATSGAPFFVTDVDPTTLPPGSTSVSSSIAPNSSKRFVVVFAPTAAGAANGTLTITSNDPANPSQTLALSGNGVTPSPAALELVLDRSGSMAQATPGGTKMADLQTTVKMFADLVIPGQGDSMGSVEFDDQVSVLTPFGPYDTSKQSQIKSDVNALFPRNLTSIGGGLQLAQGQLAGASGRRVILVFTDGMENTPPMIAAVEPGILAAGIEVYAVGLGNPQDISAAALSQLAASSNGRFFVNADTLILRKNFVQVLADAFRQSMAADPIFQLQAGQSRDIPVWITNCERRISFVVSWDNPASQLALQVIAPDGTVFNSSSPSSNQLVRFGGLPGYRYCQVALPALDPGSGQVIGPARLGRWLLRVQALSLAGVSERAAASVFVESDLELLVELDYTDIYHPVRARVRVVHHGGPPAKPKLTLRLTAPTKSLAALLTPAFLRRTLTAEPFDDVAGIGILERAARALSARKRVVPTKTRTIPLRPKGGWFEARIPAPRVEGLYQVEVDATGTACGGRFQRYRSFSVYLGRKASAGRSQVGIGPIGPNTTIVTVTPKDARGTVLGPGRAAEITASIRGGRVLAIEDRLDGSYAVAVAWGERMRKPTLKLTIGEERIDVSIVAPRTSPTRRSRRGRQGSRSSRRKAGS